MLASGYGGDLRDRYYRNNTKANEPFRYRLGMPVFAGHPSRRQRKLLMIVIMTLIASAVHFADNACHLDQYPGPRWLTRNVILVAWFVLVAIAIAAYRSGRQWALGLYGALGFAGVAHYAMPHARALRLRCAATIGVEAITSTLLILYVLRRRPTAKPLPHPLA